MIRITGLTKRFGALHVLRELAERPEVVKTGQGEGP